MHDFERKVHAAAMAGWRVVSVAAGLLIVSWLAYLAIIPAQPEWLMALWGPNLDWQFVQQVWFWAIVMFKVAVWLRTSPPALLMLTA